MFKRITIYLSLLVLLIPLANCSKKSDFKGIDPTFSWEKDQSQIEPDSGSKHLWSGFYIENDFFIAHKNIAKFILWREKKEKKEMTFHYLLKGMSVDLLINSKKICKLKPRYQLIPFKINANLLKGFNFIEFRKRGVSQFKIKTVKIGATTAAETHHIPEGETITLFHPAGSGMILVKGKGRLHVRKVEFINGEKLITEKDIQSGFLSGSQKYSFEFQTLGFLQFSAETGKFDIINYIFKNKIERKKRVKKTLKDLPHIFIFLIDGCHASHLGVYGYHRNTSPNIDRFAADGVIFENAYANATFTRSSVATIFTGFFPHRHKLRILAHALPKGLFMLPEFLKKMGYKTSILTEAGNISTFFGFAQGVDHYRKVFRKWDDPRYLENNTFKYFINWMQTKGPLFTYVHYRAPHLPIIPPPPFLDMFKSGVTPTTQDIAQPAEKKGDNEKVRFLNKSAQDVNDNEESKGEQNRVIFDLVKLMRKRHKFTPKEIQDVIDDYDSTIRYVDSEVGKLFETLKKMGVYDSSFIIFTSDHGEALYEHGTWGHGQNVYEETSRVPLIMKFPVETKLKGRIERITQLADIFPTIAALFGKKNYFDGQSLLESIKIKNEDDRFAFSTTFGNPPSIGIRWRSWYYIIHMINNQEQLYHLKIDPLKDVAALKENEDVVTFFRAKFLNWLINFDNLERASQSVDLKKLPKEEYENLKSLGYID